MNVVVRAHWYLLSVLSTNLWSADIDIYSQDAVLTAAALPLSLYVQGTNKNQVYIGMFGPDRNAPVWQGNLKLYQIALGPDNVTAILVDADGKPLINLESGLIDSRARSFWTSGDDSPDGSMVAQGGSAQALRDHVGGNRTNYTCTGFCSGLEPFSITNKNLLHTDFGAQDSQQMNSIISWATAVSNAPAHGDVIHSRPEVIDYGGDIGSYVFYASNDGMVHAVKAGLIEKSVLISSDDGEEVWAFTAPEQFKNLKALYDRQTSYDRGEKLQDTFADKPYFFDGAISSYLRYNSNNQIGNDPAGESSQAIIYLTARRGGNLIYALDVTNPLSPRIAWHKSNLDMGFSELGQTWSMPVLARLKLEPPSAVQGLPALAMGLGYDAAVEDQEGATRTQGRGIIILNALSGDIIWQHSGSDAEMDFSVPANLTTIDRNADGFTDRIYFGDTGGQLWRVDSQGIDPADWQANRLLVLPSGRKFFNAPDIVASADGSYDGVIIGSGDTEKPFDTSTQNYLIFYRDTAVNQPLAHAPMLSLDDLYEVKIDSDLLLLDTQNIDEKKFENGWYLQLEQGEKVVTRALTANNITTFATHIPCKTSGCDDLGESRIYQIDPFAVLAKADKGQVYRVVDRGGILPQPTNFSVIVEAENCETGGCNSEEKIISGVLFGPHIERFGDQALGDRRKLWWYNNQDK